MTYLHKMAININQPVNQSSISYHPEKNIVKFNPPTKTNPGKSSFLFIFSAPEEILHHQFGMVFQAKQNRGMFTTYQPSTVAMENDP